MTAIAHAFIIGDIGHEVCKGWRCEQGICRRAEVRRVEGRASKGLERAAFPGALSEAHMWARALERGAPSGHGRAKFSKHATARLASGALTLCHGACVEKRSERSCR